MGDFDKFLDEARNLAEDAVDGAKILAEEVTSKAKELTQEGSKAREIAKNAKGQASSLTQGAKEKLQGFLGGSGACKEIKQGISELEALPEFEGSIVYSMELQALVSDLKRLDVIISDDRMDTASIIEEIKSVIEKVQPSAEADIEATDEQQAIARAKDIAFNACLRALDALSTEA